MPGIKRGVFGVMRIRNGRGLSDIVSSVLLIVLAIVAVAVLWAFVNELMVSNEEGANDAFSLLLSEIQKDYQSPPFELLEDTGQGRDPEEINFDICGNGNLNPVTEQCDDGCMEGIPNVCEEVDDGDGCSSQCVSLTCEQLGGFVCEPNEACFGSEISSADSDRCCSSECVVPTGQFCNECEGLFDSCSQEECSGILEGCYYTPNFGSEDCKACSGLTSCSDYSSQGSCESDNCQLNCQWANNACEDAPSACGNGMLDEGEQCDGNPLFCVFSGYAGLRNCNQNCTGFGPCRTNERCGDGVRNGNEQCDDGNTLEGDGCSSSCMTEGSVCSNGVIEQGEICDSNRRWRDCDSSALSHWGYEDCNADCLGYGSCTVTLWCGDGTCTPEYENTASCPGDCGTQCGDTACNGNEDCSTCSQDCGDCSVEPYCGDGTINFGNGEVCDSDRRYSDCNPSSTTHWGYQDCLSDCSGYGSCIVTSSCGDSFCDFNYESCYDGQGSSDCMIDCGQCPVCGDGICNGAEYCGSCSQDCGTCSNNGNDGECYCSGGGEVEVAASPNPENCQECFAI